MKRIIAVFFALMALMISAYAEEERMDIVVTDFPCYDFVRAVAGDRAEITMLIKPGAEVHSFDPKPSDIAAMMEADAFVYIGGESDIWVADMLSSLEGGPEVVRMFDCVDEVREDHSEHADHEHEEGHTHAYDEHIWTSPVNAVKMVQAVCDMLSGCDPDNADEYALNAEAYISEINKTDMRIAEIVENAARRELVFGDRFPFLYLAQQYGLEYKAAFPGCAAETEPSAKTMMELIDYVVSNKIPAIYTIEMSNGVIADTLAAETGAEVLVLHSIQNVTADEFAAGETYVSLMNKNADALEKGLN